MASELSSPGPSSQASTTAAAQDADVDDVIADVTLKAVKECLAPSEAELVDQAVRSPITIKSPKDRETDESILMPPPDATYLQLRQHLSTSPIFSFYNEGFLIP